MKLESPYLNTVSSPLRFASAVDKLSRLQTELVSEALKRAVDDCRLQTELVSEAMKRAVDDANAAMAHQLGEPLTALLFALHEIKQANERSGSSDAGSVSVRENVDMAFREVERVCDIIERVAKPGEILTDDEVAVARGREAIDMWARDVRSRAIGAASPVDPFANLQPLTSREQEVLALVVAGLSNKEGGHRLGISTRTFEAHRAHLMGKTGARNAADLIRKTSNRNQAPIASDGP